MRSADLALFRRRLAAVAPKLTWAAQEADYLGLFRASLVRRAPAADKPA
jgi:hypothetical protein